MNIFVRSFAYAMGIFHLPRTGPFAAEHIERGKGFLKSAAGPLQVEPDQRPAFGQSIAEIYTDQAITHAIYSGGKAGGTRLMIGSELLAISQDLKARIAAANEVELRIDSPGGDSGAVAELLDVIGNRAGLAEARYAASAAAVLFVSWPGHRRIRSDGGLMLHGPGGCAMGSAEHHRRFAQWLDSTKSAWIERIVKRTGQPRRIVKEWLASDDVHFTPRQALSLNLADSISPPPLPEASQ